MSAIPDSILLSLRVALLATAIGLGPGLLLAWLLAFGRFRGRQVLDIAINLPLALPPTVMGYYLLALIGRSGPVGRLVRALGGGSLVFTVTAAVTAATVVSLPLLVQSARTSLEEVPAEVLEAAAVDGASRWHLLRYMLLPLAWPGIWTGLLLAFARALGEFGATLMVAGNIPGKTQTIPLAIYTAIQAGRMGEGNRLSLVLVAVASLAMWAGLRWRRWPGWALPAGRTGGAGAR